MCLSTMSFFSALATFFFSFRKILLLSADYPVQNPSRRFNAHISIVRHYTTICSPCKVDGSADEHKEFPWVNHSTGRPFDLERLHGVLNPTILTRSYLLNIPINTFLTLSPDTLDAPDRQGNDDDA
jgi:hypothetical protein